MSISTIIIKMFSSIRIPLIASLWLLSFALASAAEKLPDETIVKSRIFAAHKVNSLEELIKQKDISDKFKNYYKSLINQFNESLKIPGANMSQDLEISGLHDSLRYYFGLNSIEIIRSNARSQTLPPWLFWRLGFVDDRFIMPEINQRIAWFTDFNGATSAPMMKSIESETIGLMGGTAFAEAADLKSIINAIGLYGKIAAKSEARDRWFRTNVLTLIRHAPNKIDALVMYIKGKITGGIPGSSIGLTQNEQNAFAALVNILSSGPRQDPGEILSSPEKVIAAINTINSRIQLERSLQDPE